MPHDKEDQNDSHHPSADDREGWKQYWANKDQPWRTEPEISACRQYELSQRRAIQPESKKGVYPFGGVQLCRADVEWLLATHENGQGPIDSNQESQRDRVGLDLRGAQLEGANLAGLPLAKLLGGLSPWEYFELPEHERGTTRICLLRANLRGAQLDGAFLPRAQLAEADLSGAQLNSANLFEAYLNKANLERSHMNGAELSAAYLNRANLSGA
jgi:uncharacterized protein YjbI with pentapeptide repeats